MAKALYLWNCDIAHSVTYELSSCHLPIFQCRCSDGIVCCGGANRALFGMADRGLGARPTGAGPLHGGGWEDDSDCEAPALDLSHVEMRG